MGIQKKTMYTWKVNFTVRLNLIGTNYPINKIEYIRCTIIAHMEYITNT